MEYAEIQVLTTQEALEAVCNILHEAGANGVVIEDSEVLERTWESPFGEVYALSADDYPVEGVLVKGYFDEQPGLEQLVAGIRQQIEQLTTFGLQIGAGEVSWSLIEEQDWSAGWKQHYHPVRVTSRLTICPTWIPYQPEPEEIVITLDPGMAFGTGTHPTTTLTMEALEHYMKPNAFLYDVGCGTGILSIAAAKLGARQVEAVDLDATAIESTLYNCEYNQVLEQVNVNQNNLLTGYQEPADLIVANLLADLILRLLPQAVPLLKPEGYFIISGIWTGKEGPLIDELMKHGLDICQLKEETNWVLIVAQKR